MHHSRAGMVLLFVFGIIALMLALCTAFVRSMQMAQGDGRAMIPQRLAGQAADDGTRHAIAAIERSFAAVAGQPTHLGQRWRQEFWPIDTLRGGWQTSAVADDQPMGEDLADADRNGNDSPVQNLLTELYLPLRRGAGYTNRERLYANGMILSPGIGRWFEPGLQNHGPFTYINDTGTNRPLSFHIDHADSADRTATSTWDPARRSPFEDYPADLDRTLRYDERFQPVAGFAAARYRLRYAVAIEDLAGHLLCSLPGAFTPPAAAKDASAGGLPDAATADGVRELDNPLALVHADAATNFACLVNADYWPWGPLFLRGLGLNPSPVGGLPSSDVSKSASLAGFSGGTPQVHLRNTVAAGMQNQPLLAPAGPRTTQNVNIGKRGPAQSPYSLLTSQYVFGHEHLFTPFGRAQAASATPQRWFEGPAATPWRINLPTAPPAVIAKMLYAYLPSEALAVSKDRRTDGQTGAVTTIATPLRVIIPHVNLFTTPAWAATFQDLGGLPSTGCYPGTDPEGMYSDLTASAAGYWTHELGDANKANDLCDPGYAAIYGPMSATYRGDIDQLTAFDDNADGKAETFTPSKSSSTASAGGYHYYRKSYWLDILAAMMGAIGTAQYAWANDRGGSWSGAPTQGVPLWPTLTDPDHAALSGRPTFDRDLNGDGVADVPSAFDTIEELDRQFLKNLGEAWPGGSGSTVATRSTRVTEAGADPGQQTLSVAEDSGSTRTAIRNLPGTVNAEQRALMELVVNDWRMSFFGSSPQYPAFRPFDLDGDGQVRCSAYAGGVKPVDAPGIGPVPDRWFSLTGCFVLQKSRYWRIFVRGEVFDTLRGVTVSRIDRETVYAVDPDGDVFDRLDQAMAAPTTGMADGQVLFQRQVANAYQGSLSQAER
jgi:hypothetical protein